MDFDILEALLKAAERVPCVVIVWLILHYREKRDKK